jgi:hypothetical protein
VQEQIELRLLGAVFGRVAQALLGQHDAALGGELGRVEGQVPRRLPHQHQAGLQGVRVAARQVEHVDGLGPLGLGVGVRTEGQALALQDLDHLVGRHVGRAPERHVLEHMGEALFVVALLEGA